MEIIKLKESLERKGFNVSSLTKEELLLLNKCLDVEELVNASLSNGYYYNSIALCLIDAIYSIGTNYLAVCRPIVERFASTNNIDLYHDKDSAPEDYYLLDNLIQDVLNDTVGDFGATNLYHSHRPTSSASGAPLRAEIIYQIACYLRGLGINSIADFREVMRTSPKKMKQIEQAWVGRLFSGQTEVSYSYFIMLAGEDNMMKIDRWLIRFVENALGERINYSHETIREMFSHVMDVLKQKDEYRDLTLKLLDHTIWNYSKINL